MTIIIELELVGIICTTVDASRGNKYAQHNLIYIPLTQDIHPIDTCVKG